MATQKISGRSSGFNPQNRFEEVVLVPTDDDSRFFPDEDQTERKVETKFFVDTSKTALAKNDSPDVGFTYSINPYRGCEHGCIYCYARPSHEFLGFSSGLDFETKIMVKQNAAELLREAFMKKSWEPQVVAMSGDTDCYQPVERKLKITRRCLEVFLEFRNPVGIVTKNFLITRDLDILIELAKLELVSVAISITSLNQDLTKKMEPRTSSPAKKLEAIEILAKNSIPVGVLIAPVVPGLTDEEIPSILREVSSRGGTFAGLQMLRLPYAVKDLFVDWIRREFPDRENRIIGRIKQVRRGKMNSSEFKERMRGTGETARAIHQLFYASCKKYSIGNGKFHLATDKFRRPDGVQIEMF
ncbi:MAG TPA: PA0069 family radical SAM protein [Candidatus Acidoferrales bacterium]|nr:PA0069 family radical SAM protein [Candidatus Acidoferrales bacterium]